MAAVHSPPQRSPSVLALVLLIDFASSFDEFVRNIGAGGDIGLTGDEHESSLLFACLRVDEVRRRSGFE